MTICFIKSVFIFHFFPYISEKVIKEQSGVEIKVGSDMAFKLPYDRTKYKIDNERINIGINVSSLLWDSQWAKENHFGLTVDYKQYHIKILELLQPLTKLNLSLHAFLNQ